LCSLLQLFPAALVPFCICTHTLLHLFSATTAIASYVPCFIITIPFYTNKLE
jgi:hypothetical protein